MKQVLIIEDDSLVAEVYSQKLRTEGIRVDVATDGREGLEMFRNRKVDLVLLDLLLPEINGVELLKEIRSEYSARELPVLVFTNAYLGGVLQQAWEAGANQVIPKAGIKSGTVVQMVKNALQDPPPAVVPTPPTGAVPEFDAAVRQQLLDTSAQTLAALWQPLKQLVSHQGRHRNNSSWCLGELFRLIRPLTTRAAIAGLDGVARMASALEALLKELRDKPERLSPPVLLTIAQGIDTLKLLFAHPETGPAK